MRLLPALFFRMFIRYQNIIPWKFGLPLGPFDFVVDERPVPFIPPGEDTAGRSSVSPACRKRRLNRRFVGIILYKGWSRVGVGRAR